MKKILLSAASALLLCACGAEGTEVEVRNPSSAPRSNETVEIPWEPLTARQKDLAPDRVIVLDGESGDRPSVAGDLQVKHRYS